MKIRIEMDPSIEEDEVIIRCRELNSEVAEIQKALAQVAKKSQRFKCMDGNRETYLDLEEIVFFETDGDRIIVHTKDEEYTVNMRMYELEELLPDFFVRIAKSCILNIHYVKTVNKNLTGASEITLRGTVKVVFASRSYYKLLKERLDNWR